MSNFVSTEKASVVETELVGEKKKKKKKTKTIDPLILRYIQNLCQVNYADYDNTVGKNLPKTLIMKEKLNIFVNTEPIFTKKKKGCN